MPILEHADPIIQLSIFTMVVLQVMLHNSRQSCHFHQCSTTSFNFVFFGMAGFLTFMTKNSSLIFLRIWILQQSSSISISRKPYMQFVRSRPAKSCTCLCIRRARQFLNTLCTAFIKHLTMTASAGPA